jgi:transcriptional regulator with XRE-family HTH domain
MFADRRAHFEDATSEALGLPSVISLGPLMARERRQCGQSQREFADLLCDVSGRPTVTRTEISRYEREIRIPTDVSLVYLAKALRLPLSALRWAATLSRRRRLAEVSRVTIEMVPGIAIGVTTQPHPMLVIGGDWTDARSGELSL